MLKIENTEVLGWAHAIHGMRNPMNSWANSDSSWRYVAPAQRDGHILMILNFGSALMMRI